MAHPDNRKRGWGLGAWGWQRRSRLRLPSPQIPVPSPQRGFTLIEVLVASAILALSTGAVLRLSQVAIRGGDVALERTAASHLISEAFEIVHQIRDTAARDQLVNDWDASFPASPGSHFPQWNATALRWELFPTTGYGEPIARDGVTYRRFMSFTSPPAAVPPLGSADGSFRPVSSDHARQVTVQVRWQIGGRETIMTGHTLLTDWQGL